jgi:hypothetical protein
MTNAGDKKGCDLFAIDKAWSEPSIARRAACMISGCHSIDA